MKYHAENQKDEEKDVTLVMEHRTGKRREKKRRMGPAWGGERKKGFMGRWFGLHFRADRGVVGEKGFG